MSEDPTPTDPVEAILQPGDLDEARRYVEGGPRPTREVLARILRDHERISDNLVDAVQVLTRMMAPPGGERNRTLEEVAEEFGLDIGEAGERSRTRRRGLRGLADGLRGRPS